MGSLPDELWLQIVLKGVQKTPLSPRDLCALAIVSRQLKHISELDWVWQALVVHEFPEPALPPIPAACYSLRSLGLEGSDVPWKRRYRIMYEKGRMLKRAAHQRQVLRATSSLNLLQRDRQILNKTLQTERVKLVSSQSEFETVDRASRTSVALKIWQPHAVTTMHERVVHQIPVDLAARRNILGLEVQVCKQRIKALEKSLERNRYATDQSRSELDALTYNPMMDQVCKDDVGKKHGKKRKSVGTGSQLGSFVSRN